MKLIRFLFRVFFQKNQGFLGHKEKIDPVEHYMFGDGSLKAEVIKPDMNWKDDVPFFEPQCRKIETMFCTCYGTINAIETLMSAKYGIKNENYSERFTAILAGVSPYKGGSPHSVAEAIRKYGLIPEGMLPFDDSIISREVLIKPNPMTQNLLNEGKKWLEEWDFKHEWLSSPDKAKMMDALKTSPLGIGVYAWVFNKDKQVYFQPSWATPNHWCEMILVNAVQDQYWEAYDSYKAEFKKLDWNYPFKFVKRYSLVKKNSIEVIDGKALFESVKNQYAFLLRPESNGELYEITDTAIKFISVYISSNKMTEEFNRYLRANNKFVGISEKDFESITKYAELQGIKVEKPIDIEKLINK